MLKAGMRIGPYEVLSQVGAGGMGEVYRARDTRLGRDVAIKVLPAGFAADPERLARFEREARTTAALSHPNILDVHDVGTFEGVPYLVEELLQGESLRERMDRGPVPVRNAVKIAVQIAHGLAAAHERGVIHRDLKPENVFITKDGVVKILDFGLAKLVEGVPLGAADTVTHAPAPATALGQVLGTVTYMSPEQARGQAVDHRSDIFSLGCVLYEMLSGWRAFAGDTAADTVSAILTKEPAPLAGPELEVPAALRGIVGQCLEKRPEDRFSNAHDVALALRVLSEPVEESAPGPVAGPPAGDRRRWALVSGVAALLVAALIAGWALLRRAPPPHARTATEGPVRLAVLPFENLGVADDAYFAAGLTDEITGRLAGVRGLAVVSRSSTEHYTRTGKSTRQIGDELGVGFLVTGTVRWAREPGGGQHVRITPQLVRVADDTGVWGEVFDFSMNDIFRVQSDIARSVVQRLGFTLLEHERGSLEARPTENLDAYQAFLRGRYNANQPHFTAASWLVALAEFQRATELDPGFALAWAELSQAHARLVYYRYDISPQRRELARQALARARELAPSGPAVRLASGYYHLWVERDTTAALTELEAASAGLPNDAEVLGAVGELYRLRGDWQRSLETYRAACALSPREASPAVDVSETLWWMRRYPEAAVVADQAISLGPEQAWPYLTKVYNLWSWKGRAGLAEARRAAELVPREHEFWVWTRYWMEVLDGRFDESLKVLDMYRDDWIRLKIEAIPKVFFAALAYGWLGQTGRAHDEMETARRLLEAEVRAVPEDGRYHSSLGVAYAALGRRQDAVREGMRGVELLPMTKDPVYGIPHVIDLAHIYTLLGEEDHALAQIEFLLSRPGWVSAPFLQMDPRWRSLQDRPRFRALLAKYEVKP